MNIYHFLKIKIFTKIILLNLCNDLTYVNIPSYHDFSPTSVIFKDFFYVSDCCARGMDIELSSNGSGLALH